MQSGTLQTSIITLIGLAVALIDKSSFLYAVIGGLIFACGAYAVSNLYPTFLQQANDITEYRHGYRAEGTMAYGIVATLYTALLSPTNALYETLLIKFGYVAENGLNQPEERGETYLSFEEREEQEKQAALAELEAARIAGLKKKCERQGLDFLEENQKYLDKQAKKNKK